MHPILQKTLGGLSREYYFRQFVFGLAIAAFGLYAGSHGGERMPPANLLILSVVNTFLYPYSRFVYESVVSFIMGNNVFFVNPLFLLITKFMTMLACWLFAVFIAPIGFAYLYYHHSKAEY